MPDETQAADMTQESAGHPTAEVDPPVADALPPVALGNDKLQAVASGDGPVHHPPAPDEPTPDASAESQPAHVEQSDPPLLNPPAIPTLATAGGAELPTSSIRVGHVVVYREPGKSPAVAVVTFVHDPAAGLVDLTVLRHREHLPHLVNGARPFGAEPGGPGWVWRHADL